MAESLAALFGWEQPEEDLIGVQVVDFSQITLATIMHTYEPTDKMSIDLIRHACLNTLRHNVLKRKAEYPTIVIAVDNAKNGYWRRDIAYYYKKNRSMKREKDEWDWDTIFDGMQTVISEIKENLPYIVIDKDKTEADDVIGVLCKYLNDKHPSCKVLITSSDGDFTQLHKFKNVKQWSPIQKKWVKCKHGSPRNDLRYKIVKGDRKDGISTIRECSDWNFVKPEGAKAKQIRTETFLEPILNADNPLELEFMTDELIERYKENEKLLDFELIPDNIRNAIIDEFENGKVAPRSKIYPYFVKHRLLKLIDALNDF